MASPPLFRQRKNNSHSPDPPAFGRLRTGREAPYTPKARRVFCRWPPRCLKKSPCAVPGNFAQDVSSEASEKSPLPCALRVRFAVEFVLDRGKEFVRCPACVVVLVRRGLQEFGRVRAPTDNFHSGRASSKSNALAAADRSCSGRESLWAGRRAFHGKRTGDGEKRVFRHSVKSGKHPSLSVTRRFCANASVHAPIGAFRPICPPLLPSSAA